MPLYEYRCADCGETFERLRRWDDSDRELRCPRCQSEQIERLLSAFSQYSRGCSSGGPGRRFT